MGLELTLIITIANVVTIWAVMLPLFVWLRSEANSDRREFSQLIRNFQNKMNTDMIAFGEKVGTNMKSFGEKVGNDMKALGVKIDNQTMSNTTRTDQLYQTFVDLLKEQRNSRTDGKHE